jgi:hypothetical protein
MSKARIFVMYGQFGFITSMGMASLAKRIAAAHPNCLVTTHSWDEVYAISNEIKSLAEPVILVGYSLGANSVTVAAANDPKRPIALAVCYDPSVSGMIVQPTANIKRLLLYHNQGSGALGHEIFFGPMVERFDINQLHLTVCFNETLHQKTLGAIAAVVN